jgi:hypothetical protein
MQTRCTSVEKTPMQRVANCGKHRWEDGLAHIPALVFLVALLLVLFRWLSGLCN